MVGLSFRSLKHIATGFLTAALLAATGPARAASETVVYSFKGSGDGVYPSAGLLKVGGTLYGTTVAGGTNALGTVFSVTPAGAETVVYSFKGGSEGGSDASYASAGLINVRGAFYGSSVGGGTNALGTVFRVTPAGTEKVLHSFTAGSDGALPYFGSLIKVGRKLFGTTGSGGANGFGTVFSVTPAGAERVVYSFKGGSDGAEPVAGLINIGGTLYGTTQNGGSPIETTACPFGCGTVFKVNPGTGTETVVYVFEGGNDGIEPGATLISVSGTLYGTTFAGGTTSAGTVFSVTPEGVETVLHAFSGGSDGAYPDAGLIDVGGTLYGTTLGGGGSANCASGCGTVFKVTTFGTEKVMYSFIGSGDGAYPEAGLIHVRGKLYGTTHSGGANGVGTVFAVTP
jgi:uncharacterized repeat protein (TIGR03803 family)